MAGDQARFERAGRDIGRTRRAARASAAMPISSTGWPVQEPRGYPGTRDPEPPGTGKREPAKPGTGAPRRGRQEAGGGRAGQHPEPGGSSCFRGSDTRRYRAHHQRVQPAGRGRVLLCHLAVPHRRGGGQPGRLYRRRVLYRQAAPARRREPHQRHTPGRDHTGGGRVGDRGDDHAGVRGAAGTPAAWRSPRAQRSDPGGDGDCPAGPGGDAAVRGTARHLAWRHPRLP